MNLLNTLNRSWDPWKELQQLQSELGRILPVPGKVGSFAHEAPAVNVWRNEQGAIVTAEIPGLDVEKLDLSVNGDTLTLRGERVPEPLGEKERYHRQERVFGKFVRTIQLPFRIDAERTSATYERGVLEVTLHQDAQDRPQRISVKTASAAQTD